MAQLQQDEYYAELLQTLKELVPCLSDLFHMQADRNVIHADLLKIQTKHARKSLISTWDQINCEFIELSQVTGEKFGHLKDLCQVSEFSRVLLIKSLGCDMQYNFFDWEKGDNWQIDIMEVLDRCISNVEDYQRLSDDLRFIEDDLYRIQDKDQMLRWGLVLRLENVTKQTDVVNTMVSHELNQIVFYSDLLPGNTCIPPAPTTNDEDDWDWMAWMKRQWYDTTLKDTLFSLDLVTS